jgi:glycerol-3-phosphate dehydrogenase (NAD(P)+)
MKISVLGAGGWGTALAVLLSENRNDVTLYEFFPDYAAVLENKRENVKYLKGVKNTPRHCDNFGFENRP